MTQQRQMEKNEALDNIFALLGRMDLSQALDALESFGAAHPELPIGTRLREIRSDYRLMLDYWGRGYKDEHRERVYSDMIIAAYRLAADTYLGYTLAHSPYLLGISQKVRSAGRDWALASVRAQLEDFVSGVALLSLEPEHVRLKKKEALYAGHQQFLSDFFDYLLTSSQWTDSTAEAITQMLLSPTVDSIDQQLIVSAVMLGCMNVFDINKFKTLLAVYSHSTDQPLRQRALVGWVLALGYGMHTVFPEERKMVDGLLADEAVRKELAELQVQLLYCVSAENDTQTIQREIMPGLLKHGGLTITPNGIEENDGGSLEDILHPEAVERDMEKVEQSFRRMVDMQKAGADIYFGGFSQMKRFPFFDSMSNWFVPFYVDHPAISSAYGSIAESKMVRNIVDHMPFCDSDKYSFVIAFKRVADRIPQNIREMLAGGNVAGMEMVGSEEQSTPAYIRRIYLQDLYRFFRLFPSRSLFYNPFAGGDRDGDGNYLFFANSIFKGSKLESCFGDVVASLMKRRMTAGAIKVLRNWSAEGRDFQFCMAAGNIQLGRFGSKPASDLPPALLCFEMATQLHPDSEQAASGKARALFYMEEYEDALAEFRRLAERFPGRKGYELNMTVCMVNLGQCEEALKHLYKMSYENPDDVRISRVLARALVGVGEYAKADKIYEGLAKGADVQAGDLLNRGLCAWLAGRMADAAMCFADYSRALGDAGSIGKCRANFMENVVARESELLASHGVTHIDIQLMCDLTCDFIFRAR